MSKKEVADNLQAPKGMRDLLGEKYYSYQGFFERAAEIAMYYGFSPIETPMLEKELIYSSSVGTDTDIVQKEIYKLKTKGGDQLAMRPEGTAGIMRAYFENGLQSQPQPVNLYYYGPYFRHDRPQRGRYRQFYQFGLETIGSPKSINDATIIRVTMLILEEAGLKNLKLEINSIGDKECRQNYRRELVAYYRKNVKKICADCRERLKTNPLRLLDCKRPGCQETKGGAPSTVSFLCNACKSHFREVLEYLEMMDIVYEINNNLVRGLDYYSRTVFEISEAEEAGDAEKDQDGEVDKKQASPLSVAGGGRYDYLARALGHKKDVPGVGVAIGVDRVLMSAQNKKLDPRILKKPKVFFIQLSFEAKLKCLAIIEVLRKARVPLAQSISKDSLGAQLAIAEKMGVPNVMILGQKEAVDGTVIVRNLQSRSQDVVKIEKLAEYLKKLK
ncbi:MAG: histidine--tRNA ligase [Patescibacteria group bacterium]|nr:histidine--tRNA ligase [Patescibacteria group bacterium]